MSKIIAIRKVRSDSADSRLNFESEQSGAVKMRYLRLDGKRAYQFGITCNTCWFWFERKDGANASISLGDVAQRLDNGLSTLDDDLIQAIANCLPAEEYVAMLLRVRPTLVFPSSTDDYFCHEQIQVFGVEQFWGLPIDPRTEYYRTGSQLFSRDKQLFEFVVPMFPHGWLKADILEQYSTKLDNGSRPTAVAIGFLDVKAPAVWNVQSIPEVDQHWCLASFLIDGHHKMYAAAAKGAEITVLTFLAPSQGTADSVQLESLATLLRSNA